MCENERTKKMQKLAENVRGEVPGMSGEVPGMGGEVPGMDGEVLGMDGEVQGMDTRVVSMFDSRALPGTQKSMIFVKDIELCLFSVSMHRRKPKNG